MSSWWWDTKATVRCRACENTFETDWQDLDLPGYCPDCGSEELEEIV